MSHFSVLCVGDVDYNMAPFHEFECDGIDDEFVQTIDVTDKYKEYFIEAKKAYEKELDDYKKGLTNAASDEGKQWLLTHFNEVTRYLFKGETFLEYLRDYEKLGVVKSEKELDLSGVHKFGYVICDDNNNITVFKRTNPNKKYDYYQINYQETLLLKGKGGDVYTNKALKKDIDFNEMWEKRKRFLLHQYKEVIDRVGHIPSIEHTWEDLLEKTRGENPLLTYEEARELYNSQPDVKKAMNKAGWYDFFPEDFAYSEEDYIKKAFKYDLSCAIVYDRQYTSVGTIGWFGAIYDQKDGDTWSKEYKTILDSIPDDQMITILTCHI